MIRYSVCTYSVCTVMCNAVLFYVVQMHLFLARD